MKDHLNWMWARAWALLVLAAMLWAGNSVAARFAVDEVSPMTLVTLRWLVIGLVLAIAIPRQIRSAFPEMWRRRWLILSLALFGLTAFNALLYLAAHKTTAVNIVLLQSCVPVLVLLGAIGRGERIHAPQFIGIALTLLGVIVVATRGEPLKLMELAFNTGDLMVIAGCFGGAWYNLSLRKRPQLPAVVFFAGLSLAAALCSAPLLAVEAINGGTFAPTWFGWGIVIFCALGPALGAQVFFLRAVDLIGANRAGIYTNLVPVFGSFLSVMLLGENFALFHAVGLVLVLSGILLSERRPSPIKSGRLA
jgi:drug/metabolite transporter (DMT)-like permease